MRRRSDFAAYAAMWIAIGVVRALPRRLALACGGVLGLMARAAGLRRRVTAENLAIAFPELDLRRRRELERSVYRHFGRMTVDSLLLGSVGPDAVVPYVDGGEVLRLLDEALALGRGVLVLTGHIGNWELAGAYVAARGYPVSAVVKPPSNPYVAAHAERVRRRLGIETIAMPEARTRVPEALRENRVVGLVADQGAIRSNVWSPFFSRPTRTPVGPGLFAARTGAPVVFGAMIAAPGGRYRLIGEAVTSGVDSNDIDGAIKRAADDFRARLERLVRSYPDQYLWSHRLWKHQPPPGGR
ncbi:MAG TPA: lysophospholipid acyltransferase family protein [Gemmatimonadales bacterium]|nr:lysophospholipid acyltransferase family protein [Gemmatimonadales bacterium]